MTLKLSDTLYSSGQQSRDALRFLRPAPFTSCQCVLAIIGPENTGPENGALRRGADYSQIRAGTDRSQQRGTALSLASCAPPPPRPVVAPWSPWRARASYDMSWWAANAARGGMPPWWTGRALTPNTVERIPAIGAIFSRGGPVQDPVLTPGSSIIAFRACALSPL